MLRPCTRSRPVRRGLTQIGTQGTEERQAVDDRRRGRCYFDISHLRDFPADPATRGLPMTTTIGSRPLSSILARGSIFLALWIVLIGAALQDLPVGIVAAGLAAWASEILWPAAGTLSLPGLMRFAIRFLLQSVVAGVDVARRAFAPRPALEPGFVTCRTSLPVGTARRALCAVMSLQPGKLPVGAEPDGRLLIHCLDLREPILDEVAADEAAFRCILRDGG
jgi:multicomponent Na+:H+ antiporter subunit E